MRENTEIALEEIIKATMKELLTTIDLNNIEDQMWYKLNVENQEEEVEEKSVMKDLDCSLLTENLLCSQ